MPPVITAIIGGLVAIFGTAGALVVINVVTWGTLFAGGNLLLGAITRAIHGKPNMGSLSSDALNRTVTIRQPLSYARVIYGIANVGGVLTYIETSGTNNEFLHMVVTIAAHELQAIPAIYFDNVAVPLNGSGDCVSGTFSGLVHVEKNLGSRDQAAFAGLVAASAGKWTSAHRQRGRAGVYIRLKWDQNKFPNGVPNVTFDVTGRKVYDPRTGTIAYSNNSALCLGDYLNNAQFGLVAQRKYPLVASMLSNSGMASFSAANTVDGNVATIGWNADAATAGAFIAIDLGPGNAQEFRRVRIYCAGAGGGAQIYNIIPQDVAGVNLTAAGVIAPNLKGWNEIELAPNGAHRYWVIGLAVGGTNGNFTEVQFYTSQVDTAQLTAAANTSDDAITLAAGGTEPRYATDGAFDTSERPSDAVTALAGAMAGYCVYSGGKFLLYPGIWRAPDASLEFSEDDLAGALKVTTRQSKRDIFNSIRGTFISSINAWQPTHFPVVSNPTYLAEDDGESIFLDAAFPFTTSNARAQRISKIELNRNRRQITVQARFKLKAYKMAVCDVIKLDNVRFGWVQKTFEVKTAQLSAEADDQGNIGLFVDAVLRETDSNVYDWVPASDELTPSGTSAIVLASLRTVQPVTGLGVSPIEVTRVVDGVKVNYIDISWTSPTDQFVLNGGGIRVQFKRHIDSVWTDIGKQPGDGTTARVGPVIDGTQYDIQVFAENTAGVFSSAATATVTPTGSAVTLDTIADGLWSTHDVQYEGGSVSIDNADFEASASLVNNAPPGWMIDPLVPSTVASYETSTQQSGNQSVKLVITTAFGNLATIKKYKVLPGELYRISGYIKTLAGLNGQIQCWFADASGAFLNQSVAQSASASWTFVSGTGTVPANAVYMVIRLGIAAGATGTAWYDNIHVVRAATAFEVTPINTSGTFTSTTPLSQSGITKTINIGASTMQFGDGTVSYNSGSVTPLVFGTFYIYADDAGFAGGAVSYQFTQIQSDVYAANGRVYFGKITTSGGGGGAGTGGGTGGGRVQL
jgi:hypothetical protein